MTTETQGEGLSSFTRFTIRPQIPQFRLLLVQARWEHRLGWPLTSFAGRDARVQFDF